jgi:hypothetical protein
LLKLILLKSSIELFTTPKHGLSIPQAAVRCAVLVHTSPITAVELALDEAVLANVFRVREVGLVEKDKGDGARD